MQLNIDKFLGFLSEYPGLDAANRMYKAACEIPLAIKPGTVFAGTGAKALICGYQHVPDIYESPETIENMTADYPEQARLIRDLSAARERVTDEMIDGARSEEEKAVITARACWGGWFGHTNPDYGLILNLGTDGLREKAERYRKINAGRDGFYDSMLIALDALDKLAQRYAALASELSTNAYGDEKASLLRIANALGVAPKKPAYDFFSACQAFWLVFSFDGVDSPGRFDQYMYPFYKITDENARRGCLEALWQLFHETRTWNLCIGGSDEYYNDMSNPLSYEILDTAIKYKYNTPNLSMRIHKNTPAALMQKAVDALAEGIGMPVLYSDETVCSALEAIGVRAPDAHLYCMNGCNQIDIMGKSHMGLEDGEVSLIKCLEFALFNGVCQITGIKAGLETGEADSFKNYDEFYGAYKRQVEYVADLCVGIANKNQEIYAKHSFNPFKSALLEGCVEKGLDYKAGGAIYNHGQILTQGIADTADSLAIIKHFVFEEKLLGMEELVRALSVDFKGFEALHSEFINFTKFGNGDAYVDDIARDIIGHFFSYLVTKPTYRGGVYGGGCSTWVRGPDYGKSTGAAPSGRLKGSPLVADSIAAVPGCDVNGPTALMNSVLKYDHTLAKSGFVFNLKFDKGLFSTDKGKKSFLKLADVFFKNGGQQLSVGVVSAEDLHKAKLNPEAYKNLVVRVAGFSEYFVNLTEELQDSVIRRTVY